MLKVNKLHIGISGPIASGKSTLAQSLKALFEFIGIPTRIVPFAEDLKWMASLHNVDDIIPLLLAYFRKLNYPEDKVWRGTAEVINALRLYPVVENTKPRKLYQYLGTEVGRIAIDSDIWVKAVQHRIAGDGLHTYFISDDLRFINEAKSVDFHVHIDTANSKAYETRKATFPTEYVFDNHASEKEVLFAPHYTITTDFMIPDVIKLAQHVNHQARKNIVLTQQDLPDAMRNFSKSLDDAAKIVRGMI